MSDSPFGARVLTDDAPALVNRSRLFVFLFVFVLVAGVGLAYDFSRPAVYGASARISVEPPGVEDALAKAQFAVSEALALQKSEILTIVGNSRGVSASALTSSSGDPRLAAEAIPQTSVIELRAQGGDRDQIVSLLTAWIDAYQSSRRQSDQAGEAEAVAEARHAAAQAQKAVAAKTEEMEAFRLRHGIASVEREENPGAARLKGLHAALNEAEAKEVAAEAKLKSIDDSLGAGRGVVRAADRGGIANLEMRALDLREKMKDLEQDFTAQYLALDPKYKALKANLQRLEQQIETEKKRSLSTAKIEAQEEYAGAQRATQKLREQVATLQKDTQSFSVRFLELKRMTADLEKLQEDRREAVLRLQRIESARQPAAVRVQVLGAPMAGPDPVAPAYGRDAAIALAVALALAIGAVWLRDYLTRRPPPDVAAVQPIIQIAYPALSQAPSEERVRGLESPPPPLLSAPSTPRNIELNAGEVGALWANADAQGRLILGLIFCGVAPDEIGTIRGRDVERENGCVRVGGASARQLGLIDPLRAELIALGDAWAASNADRPLIADGTGQPLELAQLDTQLACLAHDAGLRQPEAVTTRVLHFTYAAYLARQGVRMSEIHALAGRLGADVAGELLRLSPPAGLVNAAAVERVYPAFRPA